VSSILPRDTRASRTRSDLSAPNERPRPKASFACHEHSVPSRNPAASPQSVERVRFGANLTAGGGDCIFGSAPSHTHTHTHTSSGPGGGGSMLAYSDRSGNSARCSLICVCVCVGAATRLRTAPERRGAAARPVRAEGQLLCAGCAVGTYDWRRHVQRRHLSVYGSTAREGYA
jgi:hypothetical protein